MIRSILAFVALTLCISAGCYTSQGVRVAPENLDALILGVSTVTDVEAQLGMAEEVQTVESYGHDFDVHFYDFSRYEHWMGKWDAQICWTEFVGENLNGYVFVSSIEEERNDFPDSLRAEIQIGEHVKDDIHALFGQPSGKTQFPTTVYNRGLFEGIQLAGDESYKESWCYIFSNKDTKKILVILFDMLGRVEDHIYTSRQSRKSQEKTKASEDDYF